jgi:hypothetical protein
VTEAAAETDANRAIVARLVSILNGETPIEAGMDIVAPDVVAHVDGWTFQGINVWANWIDYIRSRGRVSAPSLLVDDVVVNPDATITVRGRWQGVRFGRVATSLPGAARYRLARGRIVEIWSTRRNYSFLCGLHTAFHSGFALELLRLQWVRRRAARLDLRHPSRHRRPPGFWAAARSR